MEGYVKFHRKLIENAIFYKADYYQIWSYILLKVNHKDTTLIWNNEKKFLKKGSGIFSQKEMAKLFKFEISKINRILKYLKNENQISFIGFNSHTEIQVINWEEYQEAFENGNPEETKKKPKRNPTETKKKPGRNPEETDKNDKNEDNDKNDNNEENIIFPFESENFKSMWQLWKKFKKDQFNFTFANPLTEQAALKKLSEDSEAIEADAIKIIEKSLSNNWQGLFPLKKNEKSNSKTDPTKFGAQLDALIERKYGSATA